MNLQFELKFQFKKKTREREKNQKEKEKRKEREVSQLLEFLNEKSYFNRGITCFPRYLSSTDIFVH